jgi:hypothetical protein
MLFIVSFLEVTKHSSIKVMSLYLRVFPFRIGLSYANAVGTSHADVYVLCVDKTCIVIKQPKFGLYQCAVVNLMCKEHRSK